ncbi:MAG: hypothetical protein L0Z55_06590 [Planctomycetes bacterium]|nr:hypothetical protein [Planctomycetota bacterium]
MNFARRIQEVLLRLIDLLEGSSTPYALMGGLAVPVWGIPRATYDIDIMLAVENHALDRVLAAAKESGFEVDQAFAAGFRDVLQGMRKIQLEWWTEESRRIEVVVFLVTTAYQGAAFARRRRARIDHRDVWVLAPADLILHKLVAGRPKDLGDVQNILAIQGLVDEAYLRDWARRLGVDIALAAAIESVDLPPGAGPPQSN